MLFRSLIGDVAGEAAEEGGAGVSRTVNIMLFDNAEAVTKPIGSESRELVRPTVPLKPAK